MKCFYVIILSLMFTISTLAQENSFKPATGSTSAEVNFRPVSNNPISISSLKFRSYRPNGQVFRIGVLLGGKIEKPNKNAALNTVEISLKPAFEKHLYGTERLSPYYGVEFELSYKYSSFTFSDPDSDIDIKYTGAWDEFGNEQGFIRVGANVIIGADYYITKNVYLGTEFGFGGQIMDFTDIKLKIDSESETLEKNGGAFTFGPNYNGALRLGFSF